MTIFKKMTIFFHEVGMKNKFLNKYGEMIDHVTTYKKRGRKPY